VSFLRGEGIEWERRLYSLGKLEVFVDTDRPQFILRGERGKRSKLFSNERVLASQREGGSLVYA